MNQALIRVEQPLMRERVAQFTVGAFLFAVATAIRALTVLLIQYTIEETWPNTQPPFWALLACLCFVPWVVRKPAKA